MARAGRRYPLIVYQQMMNRWWPVTLTLALGLFLLAFAVARNPYGIIQAWRWQGLVVLGGLAMLFTMGLLIMRGAAYVQPMAGYLRLVTPFLRLNISYRRFMRTSTAEMQSLFPPAKVRGWKRELLSAYASRTAVVIELNGWPAPPALIRFFLSQFFFKDQTPHFVILVQDWMRFSHEMESLRSGAGTSGGPRKKVDQSILSRLPHQDR